MIKIYLVKILDWIITSVQHWKNKLSNEDDTIVDKGFIPLSPVDDIDDKFYLDTLYWALKSRKKNDIKNIALTGPYGSGKSSVLKTFQKEYKNHKGLKFLNISLATFKEEDNGSGETIEQGGNGNTVNKSILPQIEVSILQQMFYHEKDKDIPDSRFKKIKSFNSWILLAISLYFILFVISSIRIFSPEFFSTTLNIDDIPNWFSIVCYVIFCVGLGFLIYKSIRIISAITIEKLKFQDAEIGFGNKTSKSILNHHLDEIFYFFEKGKYNVVIIEDLDRFKQTEIFTKLREINQLLNNSKKTKKLDITFIYAIRDEVFTDKERTKFFDFIIPIIPTINSSNSGDFLQTLNSDKELGLSESFIEDIAFYIDDRRLLHNICNEFLIYKNKITGLLYDKLFALIAYKNIYPKDFASLSEQKGALYNAIQAKQQVVVERNNSLNEKIDTLKKELDSLNKLYVRNEEDLRSIYIFKLISKLSDPVSFKVGDRTINFPQLVDEDSFNYFKEDKLVYNKWQSYGAHQSRRVDIPFESIENEVNPEKNYERLLKEIRQLKSGRLKQINQEINTLQEQKLINRNKPIHELIKEDGKLLEIIREQVEEAEINGKTNPDSDKDELQLVKKKNVISRLLRSGYIAEDYTHYISIFHEGALTEKDNVFSSSVRNRDSLDFDFELTNMENLVKRINVLNFKTDAILNYDLVDFLIEKRKNFPEQYEYVIEKLSDESERSIAFIKGFIKISGNVVDFIKAMVKSWPNIWRYFSQTDLLNEVDLKELFFLLINNANVSDLENVSQDSDFIDRIEDNSDFLNVISNQDRVIEILDHLGIKLLDVNMDIAPDGLLEYVYKNNHYQITPQTIKKFIKYFGNFDQMDWDRTNYKAIQNSECKPLIKYLNNEIQQYIDKVYLVIESNIEEEESHYRDLLNNPAISLKCKLQLIKRVKTKLSHIEQVEKRDNNLEDKELKTNILNEGKLEPTWDSLYVSYNDNLPWKSITNFINIGDNAQKLGNIIIPETVDDDENYIYLDFSREILISNGIRDNAYNQILYAFPFNFDSLNISALSETKVNYLIEHEILVVNSENFEMLKRHHINSLIIFIEHNSTEIIENLDDFDFEGEDLNKVLNSTIISASNKNQFINGIEEQKIFDAPQNVQLILSFLNQNSFLEIKKSLLNKLLLSSHGTTNTRIEVFNARHQSIELEEVINFLESLPGDFKEIPNPNRRAPIPYSTVNEELLKILRDKEIINNYSKRKEKLRVSHKRS